MVRLYWGSAQWIAAGPMGPRNDGARAEKSGKGYQTLINEALRNALLPEAAPVTEASVQRVVQQALKSVLKHGVKAG